MNGAIRKLLALTITLVLALAAPSLRAEGAQIVEFSSSEQGCPEAGFVNARFWQLVGESAESTARAVVTLTKTQAERYEFLIRITNGDQTGERRFSASSCRLGAATAALIIAISLFPERANDLEQRSQDLSATTEFNGPQPTPRKENAKPQTSSVSVRDDLSAAAPTRPRRPTGARRELHATLSLGSGLDTTSLPRPAIGFGAAVSVWIDRISIELSSSQFASQTVNLRDQRHAEFALLQLGGHACYAVLYRPTVTISPCLGATVARVAGEGFGAQQNFERVGVYGGPAFGAALRWRLLEPLYLRIYAESFLSLTRPRFELDNQLVHRAAPAGVSVFVGSELRF